MKYGRLALALSMLLAWPVLPAVAAEEHPKVLGKHLVEHLGCLYCHGLGGRKGLENPDAVRKYIPGWDEQAFIARYPSDEGLRQVIIKGRFPQRAKDAKGNPIPMPPWGNRIKPGELDAIVAYIMSLRETPVSAHEKGGLGAVEDDDDGSSLLPLPVSVDEPRVPHRTDGPNPQIALGKGLVNHLGCLYCHGLGGREGLPNPSAMRKHVPAWDSKEFIARYPVDDGVRYVITNGRKPQKDPAVSGTPIPMPPWGNRIKPNELDAIVAYIWSLRDTPVSSHQKGGLGSGE